MNRSVGIVLIVLGIAMLIWTGFSYTKKEKVINAGPLQVSVDKEKRLTGLLTWVEFYWLVEF